MSSDNPILNNPYQEPKLHYDTDSEGSLDYNKICEDRRIYKPDVAVIPSVQKGQKEIFGWNDSAGEYVTHIINLCRQEVGNWRKDNYPNTTRITRELLSFWFNNPERIVTKKLFFAQQEAIETAIWLNEVAGNSNPGQHILVTLRRAQQGVSEDHENQLPRIAFKMATGTGKTVVMACLICYHYFNRQEYRNDTRFADYFLVVAPGITIKSRLGVLFVDTKNKNPRDIQDYYRIRGLVPPHFESRLENLNARLVITNYHAFEPKILQGNKRSPFDGKVNLKGEKVETDNKEDFSQVIKRVIGKFKTDSRLLILNDEAHHCYLPKSKLKTTDNEEADENVRAAVWFNGLKEIAKKFKVQGVYDLSATPYYLSGSGYEAYRLFPWVVTDFGLIEAIESGLVKIPFLPEVDDTQETKMAVLRNLYDHVKDELPKKGQRAKKSESAAKGEKYKESPPQLPAIVKVALDQFYNHYKDYFDGIRKYNEETANIFSAPPVFIVVCNNTSVSKEVYKYIAGYEYTNEDGQTIVVPGVKDLFSNYDFATNRPLRKPPTLLIDSDALENGEQINDEFKKIFTSEIEEFKKDYARLHGQGSIEQITDGEILREVVNTVGQQSKLGSHIRCVVSVSMLTEGWDANTVTHIMGLRAFGSQLLCEQVAGRALRRVNYLLKTYKIDTGEEIDIKDKHKFKAENLVEKFPPEYAHIIGVPFKMFKGGESAPPPQPEKIIHVTAIDERESEREIEFPNVVGYRLENVDGEIKYDFSGLENYQVEGNNYPIETIMESPISPEKEKLQVRSVLERRENELIFLITKELIKYHFSDDDGNPQFQKFSQLKNIVAEWYETKVQVLNRQGDQFKKLLFFMTPKSIVDHIARGINTDKNTVEFIRPVFNFYNKYSSTKYVNGNTIKDVFPTQKSHVNYVVMDSDWEAICAKTLEEIDEVKSYVKNQFLGFAIPYVKDGKDKLYYPDFIVSITTKNGVNKNLIIEITGMSKEKDEKKWYVLNRWLPAVNALKDKLDYDEWDFLEVADDVRDIKNLLLQKLNSL
ncbi:MAG TPA: DEAD/DEAH box helicase family protein [Mucilaginibacter sp.]|nr:DEAD/DEAH box helicase family protein [Mucilaginibacter sp.]